MALDVPFFRWKYDDYIWKWITIFIGIGEFPLSARLTAGWRELNPSNTHLWTRVDCPSRLNWVNGLAWSARYFTKKLNIYEKNFGQCWVFALLIFTVCWRPTWERYSWRGELVFCLTPTIRRYLSIVLIHISVRLANFTHPHPQATLTQSVKRGNTCKWNQTRKNARKPSHHIWFRSHLIGQNAFLVCWLVTAC